MSTPERAPSGTPPRCVHCGLTEAFHSVGAGDAAGLCPPYRFPYTTLRFTPPASPDASRPVDGELDALTKENAELREKLADTVASNVALQLDNATLTKERDAAQSDEPMRGDWQCPTCGFVESRRQISFHNGNVSTVPVADDPRCPNDGVALQPMTWRMFAKQVMALVDSRDADLAAACTALESREAELREARKALQWASDFILDGLECPPHACEFTTNPEKGACDVCDGWARVCVALSSTTQEQGETP